MAILFLVLMFLVSGAPVFASRITIETETTTGTVGQSGISIKAKLLQGESADSGNSFRENASIKITSSRDGDKCDTIGGGSDVNGYIYGTCYATQTGSYAVYVLSDRGDSSPEVSLTFNEAPKNSDPSPTPKEMNDETQTTTQSAQKNAPQQAAQKQSAQPASNNPFLQDGLVAEQERVDNGLAVQGQESVAGATDTSQIDNGAPDLLKSLIFLTGALVLLIWSSYLIYLQIRMKRS